ncbi:hypothetical protein ACKWTF_016292 [Chironomus riparius]
MPKNIISTIKSMKLIGNIFGFVPFCLEKNHKRFKLFYILNNFYAFLLILLMIQNLYHNITVAIKFFEGGSLLPDLVHQYLQASPMIISIVITCGIFAHTQEISELVQFFNEIDNDVSEGNLWFC